MSLSERLKLASSAANMSKTRLVEILKDLTNTDTKRVKDWLNGSCAEISDEHLELVADYFEATTGHGVGWWRYGEAAFSAYENQLINWAQPHFEREKQIENLIKRASQYCTWEMKTVDFSVEWSNDTEDVFGFMPEQNMMSMMSKFDDKARADASQAILKCVCLEQDFFSIIFNLQQDGETRRVLFYGRATISQEDGGREYVASIQGAASDVSAMQLSYGDLNVCQSSLQKAMHSGAGIISIIDTEGAVSLLHGRMLDDLGISVASYLRRTVFDLRGQNDGVDNLARALSGESFSTQVTFGEHIIETEFSPIYKESGVGIMGLVAAVKNVYATNKQNVSPISKPQSRIKHNDQGNKILQSLASSTSIK